MKDHVPASQLQLWDSDPKETAIVEELSYGNYGLVLQQVFDDMVRTGPG